MDDAISSEESPVSERRRLKDSKRSKNVQREKIRTKIMKGAATAATKKLDKVKPLASHVSAAKRSLALMTVATDSTSGSRTKKDAKKALSSSKKKTKAEAKNGATLKKKKDAKKKGSSKNSE